MGHRRKARETALQGLYMHEVGKADIDTITRFDWLEETLSEEIRKFAVTDRKSVV